jgi:leucine dehydrogenase
VNSDWLDTLARDGFEELHLLHDQESGLRAVLAVHDTSAGPCFGGIRRLSYRDEADAIRDCLSLARAMTFKCALAELPAGGAKLVMLDRGELDLQRAYEFLGLAIERLRGRYFSGPDVGTGARELAWVAARTRYVTDPGPEGPGELADATAAGVVAGIGAALLQLDGDVDWPRRSVVVQGLGEVGEHVARDLSRRGARVLAAELDGERAERISAELGLELIDPASELDVACDVLCPCALGGIVHDLSLLRLRCRVLAGAANNVLASAEHGERLHERGVLYVPDFALNSGALIRGAHFHLDGRREPVPSIAARIGEVVTRILARAVDEDLSPIRVAELEAEQLVERRRGRS